MAGTDWVLMSFPSQGQPQSPTHKRHKRRVLSEWLFTSGLGDQSRKETQSVPGQSPLLPKSGSRICHEFSWGPLLSTCWTFPGVWKGPGGPFIIKFSCLRLLETMQQLWIIHEIIWKEDHILHAFQPFSEKWKQSLRKCHLTNFQPRQIASLSHPQQKCQCSTVTVRGAKVHVSLPDLLCFTRGSGVQCRAGWLRAVPECFLGKHRKANTLNRHPLSSIRECFLLQSRAHLWIYCLYSCSYFFPSLGLSVLIYTKKWLIPRSLRPWHSIILLYGVSAQALTSTRNLQSILFSLIMFRKIDDDCIPASC